VAAKLIGIDSLRSIWSHDHNAVDWLSHDNRSAKKELSMIPSKIRAVPRDPSQQKDVIADCGAAHGPMSQQGAGDSHSHEMHPQKLVQLVGCHDPNAGKQEDAHRPH
jgi:hypothetical protein